MVIQNFENFIRISSKTNVSKNHTNDDGLMWNGVIISFKQPFKKESLLKNISSLLLSISIPRAFMFSAIRGAFIFSLLKRWPLCFYLLKKSYLACFYLLCAFRKMAVVKNLSVCFYLLCALLHKWRHFVLFRIARAGLWFSIYLTFIYVPTMHSILILLVHGFQFHSKMPA